MAFGSGIGTDQSGPRLIKHERDLVPPPAPVDLSDADLEELGDTMFARMNKLRGSTIERLHVKGRAALLRAL